MCPAGNGHKLLYQMHENDTTEAHKRINDSAGVSDHIQATLDAWESEQQ